MSTDFQTLKECKEAMKGAFIGIIVKQGDLQSGTSNKGTSDEKDWTYKRFTIQDATASIELTAWGAEVEKFKVGNKYEFNKFWFKTYKESTVLSMGDYGELKLIGTATIPAPLGQTTIPEPEPAGRSGEPKPAVGEPVLKGGDFKKLAKEAIPLPEIGGAFADFIETECITLLQIEKIVKETMTTFEPTKIQDGGKVGMHTKEIYRESKKSKFEKASES